MLFNTLDYARFFAFVFVVSWALVERRWALLLPWLVVAGVAAGDPSQLSLGLTGAGLLVTAALLWVEFKKPSDPDAPGPSARSTWIQILVQGSALVPLLLGDEGGFSRSVAGLTSWVPPGWLSNLSLGFGLVFAFLLVRARKVRLLFILGASYVFYAHWDYRFLPLIWGSSTADYLLARAIHAAKSERTRKLWLLATVVMNLGVLAFFKYWNLSVEWLAPLLGVESTSIALRVALPIGISFFTFESMSYVIDVYRRELEPQKSYAEYLSFVAFFPHLVAGPIVRPRDLLPQLTGPARFSSTEASEGLFLIAVGLSKKIVIGDYLALNLVDRVFDAPYMYSSLEVYAATIGYALQIYCDFSGYTDIAIGSALLLGVRFPLNFNSPYKAYDIADFWRRWHISLSTWLRDYLYIPLGGNRKGRVRTYLNLFLTMVLGGIWHGSSDVGFVTFVIWGGLHGFGLGVNRWWSERKKARGECVEPSPLRRVFSVFLTFHFVCVGWIFFRAASVDRASLVFTQLGEGSFHFPNLPWNLCLVLALGLVSHFVPDAWFNRLREGFTRAPALVQGLALFLVALLLRQMASSDSVPFVYFQF